MYVTRALYYLCKYRYDVDYTVVSDPKTGQRDVFLIDEGTGAVQYIDCTVESKLHLTAFSCRHLLLLLLLYCSRLNCSSPLKQGSSTVPSRPSIRLLVCEPVQCWVIQSASADSMPVLACRALASEHCAAKDGPTIHASAARPETDSCQPHNGTDDKCSVLLSLPEVCWHDRHCQEYFWRLMGYLPSARAPLQTDRMLSTGRC